VFEAALKTGKPIWVGFSTRRGNDGKILSAMAERDVLFEEVLDMVKGYDFDVAGIMHTNVENVSDSLAILKKNFDRPLMVYPDSGGWVSPNWDFDKIIKPIELLKKSEAWVQEGAQIIGGCCGLSPEHISAISTLKR
jgi:S-methylmethionine-dependent homocysteine/selenocysteine methylase